MTRALLLVALAACSAGPPGPGIDVDRAMQDAAGLVAIGPRTSDSASSRAAADYLEARLRDAGATVERVEVGPVTIPAIDALGMHLRDEARVLTTDPDLVVRFGPAGPALLFMAHYDTVPNSPGAVDDAASCAVLVELARTLAAHPPASPVMIAFTANEELGLVGAEGLASQRAQGVSLAIALDMIGGSGDLSLNGASTLVRAPELRWLASAADAAGVIVRAPLPHRVVSRWFPAGERADHGAFTRRGVRAFHLYHRGQEGERIDLAYHSPRDVLARIDRAHVDDAGRLVVALAARAPPPRDDDTDAGFWLPLAANAIVPRAALIAVEILLALGALAGIVAACCKRRERGGLGLLAGALAFSAAAGLSYGIARALAGDHPAPWLHAPLTHELATLAILAGAFALFTRLFARLAPWRGDARYLALAIAAQLALGLAWLATGAAELAWIFLVPAAATAAAPLLGRFAPLALASNALPFALILAPATVREAAWNAIWPTPLPLAPVLALLALPAIASAAWLLRRRAAPLGPLGTLVLAVGSALAIAGGIAVLGLAPPACTGAEFRHFHLACEVVREVRYGLH